MFPDIKNTLYDGFYKNTSFNCISIIKIEVYLKVTRASTSATTTFFSEENFACSKLCILYNKLFHTGSFIQALPTY